MSQTEIPGYSYGSGSLPRSPMSLEEFSKLQESVLFGEDDRRALRQAAGVLRDQIGDVLDVWYGFVASHPHLVHYFSGSDGKPVGPYLAAVRRRFEQWVLDTCERDYDQQWLDYQHEIAMRHHRVGKNRTDNVKAVDHIPLRYLIAFIYPITATMRPFLAKKGNSAEEVEQMQQAWTKSVVLQVTLWSRPYAVEGDF